MDRKSITIALVAYAAGELVTMLMTRARNAKVNAYNQDLFEKLEHKIRVLKMDAQAARNLAMAVVNGADPQKACEQHDFDVQFLNLLLKQKEL